MISSELSFLLKNNYNVYIKLYFSHFTSEKHVPDLNTNYSDKVNTLIKRYQYVSLISEDLLLGPIKTFKLSRKISEEKGWYLFNIWFLSSLVASLPVAFLNLITSNLVVIIISALYFPWIRYNTRVLVLMQIYKEYMKKGE